MKPERSLSICHLPELSIPGFIGDYASHFQAFGFGYIRAIDSAYDLETISDKPHGFELAANGLLIGSGIKLVELAVHGEYFRGFDELLFSKASTQTALPKEIALSSPDFYDTFLPESMMHLLTCFDYDIWLGDGCGLNIICEANTANLLRLDQYTFRNYGKMRPVS